MSLDGKVAWVAGVGGEGEAVGRAVALALSARGVRVLVTGPVEKVLGVVVGEVAHGGGKARHLVVATREPAAAEAAVARAIEAFGRLDFAIVCAAGAGVVPPEPAPLAGLMDAFYTFAAARGSVREEGRLVAISAPVAPSSNDGAAVAAARAGLVGLVAETAREVSAQRVTCNGLFPAASDPGSSDPGSNDAGAGVAMHGALGRAVAPEDVAEIVVFLCGTGGAALTGQSLDVGAANPLRAR